MENTYSEHCYIKGILTDDTMKEEMSDDDYKYNEEDLPSVKVEVIDIKPTILDDSKFVKEKPSGEQQFCCFTSGERFKSKRILHQHFETTEHEQEYLEITTNLDAGDESEVSDVTSNFGNNNGEKPFTCVIRGCHVGFDSKEALLEHKQLAHNIDHQFRCSFEGCPKSFKREVALLNHSLKHKSNPNIDQKSFKCWHKGCTNEYSYQSQLDVHLHVHSDVNSFKCDVKECGLSFNTLNAKTSHRRRHFSDRPEKCLHPGCSKGFKSKGALTTHMKSHLMEKLCVCPEERCGNAFTHQKRLTKHLRIHSEQRQTYSCGIDCCEKTFFIKTSLYIHARKVHGRDLLEEQSR